MTHTAPSATPTGRRPLLPLPCLLAVAAAATGMAAWLPASNRPGVFFPIVAVVAGSAVALAGGVNLNLRTAAWGGTGLVLVAMTAIRSAEWLVVPNLLLALVYAALAVSDPRDWTAGLAGLFAPSARLPEAPGALVRSASAAAGSADPAKTARLFRALIGAGVLLTVFWALFASADRAFARLTEWVLPDWDLGLLPARAVIFGLTCLVTVAFVLAGARGSPSWLKPIVRYAGRLPFKLSRTEWVSILGLLNALFLAFGIVQILVLFRGHDHILRTAGLTYAEYARSGFFQLLFAAALTLPVVTVAWVGSLRSGRADELLLKALLGSLCLLTLLIVASALRRLGLYEEALGFTRPRLAAHAGALWLGALLLAMLVLGGAGRTRHLFPAVLAVTAAALLAFNFANPDAAIAERNWQRYRETGKIDLDYLSRLSADAVPFLSGLAPGVADAALAAIAERLPDDEAWSSANLSRIRARSLLERREPRS